MFKVNLVTKNPKDESLKTPPIEAIVDTGSELTWIPADALNQIQVRPERERSFATATKQIMNRQVGFAILEAEGYRTIDEVVFAEPGDLTLLGVRTLEGFGVAVDNIGHRFVAQITLVAAAGPGGGGGVVGFARGNATPSAGGDGQGARSSAKGPDMKSKTEEEEPTLGIKMVVTILCAAAGAVLVLYLIW